MIKVTEEMITAARTEYDHSEDMAQALTAGLSVMLVDKASLADVIWGEQEARVLDGYVIHTRATAATTARAVSVWLRGSQQ